METSISFETIGYELELAIKHSSISILKNLISKIQSYNESTERYNLGLLTRCLLKCVKEGSDAFCVDAINVLLEEGADVNGQDESGSTALHYTSEKDGNFTDNCLVSLINYGANIQIRNNCNISALDQACWKGSVKSIKLLSTEASKLDCRSGLFYTAMIKSCEIDRKEALVHLVMGGGDVNSSLDDDIGSPLHVACENGHDACVSYLLHVGANFEMLRKSTLETPLMRAAEHGHASVIELLLKAGAEIDRQTENCSQALIIACHFGMKDAVDVLLANGADVRLMNQWDFPPLFMAADNSEIMPRILQEENVQIDQICGDRGEAALHLAAVVGEIEVIRLLLKAGGNINVQTTPGESALWLAAWKGHVHVTRLLIGLNCSLDDKSNGCQVFAWEYLPVEVAIGKGHFEIMKMCLKAGCTLQNDLYLTDCRFGTLRSVPWLRFRPEVMACLLNDDSALEWLGHYLANPRTLMDIARLKVRHMLGNSYQLIYNVNNLNLPNTLKVKLLFCDL